MFYLDFARSQLDNVYRGRTISIRSLTDIITHETLRNDMYEFRMNCPRIDYFGDKLLIGELTELKSIMNVEMICYDNSDMIVIDTSGNPLRYLSSYHQLGHRLDIFHRGYGCSYVTIRFKLQSKTYFDQSKLFFHFSYTTTSTEGEMKTKMKMKDHEYGLFCR